MMAAGAAEGNAGRSPSDPEPGFGDYLQEALQFRAWGFTTLPIGPDKKPPVRWKPYQLRKPTDAAICRMFDAGGSRVRGLGVLHGRASGRPGLIHAARDFDTAAGYAAWADANPGLAADCPTVFSARGAHVHLFIRGDREQFVRFDGADKRFPAGELRASSKHLTVLPPSRHPSGVRYRWRDGPPCSPRDFPAVRLNDTGFLPGTEYPTTRTPDRRHRTPEHTPRGRPRKHPNGLCPLSPPPGLDELPRAVREAVLRTQPRRPGERESRLLALARALAGIDPEVEAGRWLSAVRYWWAAARAVIRTEPWEPTWRAFARAWNRCDRTTADTPPPKVMARAVDLAGDDPRERLLAACAAVAVIRPAGVFSLSARQAAQLARIGKTRAAELLVSLCSDGLLELVTPGTRGAYARRANEYRLTSGDAQGEES